MYYDKAKQDAYSAFIIRKSYRQIVEKLRELLVYEKEYQCSGDFICQSKRHQKDCYSKTPAFSTFVRQFKKIEVDTIDLSHLELKGGM